MTNIFIIGMMGSGKSYLGKLLSDKISLPLFDIDSEIEKIMNISIDEIFNNYGEERFRLIESALFKEMVKGENHIYSTGGGIILDPLNQKILKEKGFCFFLDCPIDVIIHRIERDKINRPVFKNRVSLELIYKKRNPLYLECADYVIDVNDKKPSQIIQEIEKMINEQN